jgi:hypothetical protein
VKWQIAAGATEVFPLRVAQLKTGQRPNITRDQFEFAIEHILKPQPTRVARTNDLVRRRFQQMPMHRRQPDAAQLTPLQHRLRPRHRERGAISASGDGRSGSIHISFPNSFERQSVIPNLSLRRYPKILPQKIPLIPSKIPLPPS